jgi:DnaK suppressor protein
MQNCKLGNLSQLDYDNSDYVPSDNEPEYMNEKQLNYFRNILLKTREEIILGSIKSLESIREESKISPDENDLASMESSIAITLKIRENSVELLSKLDYALQKLEDGEYGYCEESGDEIGISRLKVSPLAQYSLEVQAYRERYQKRSWDNDNFPMDE